MGFFGRLFKGIGNVIKKIAKKLGIIDEEIGSSKSTNENSQVNDIAYMSKTLDSYSQTYKKLAENLEDNCINFVDGYFDQLLTDLSGLTELYQSIDVSHLRKTQNNIRGQIRGAYINPIKIRLSLDDNECRKIIKLAPGDSKTQKIKEFSNRVFLEANKNLIESVQKVLQEQIEEINTRVAEYVNNSNFAHPKQACSNAWQGNVTY